MTVQRFNMGLDVGYGNTKAVWSADAGPEHNVILPSVAHEITDLGYYRAMSGDGQTDNVLIEVDGSHFAVGPSTGVYGRTLLDDYIHTRQYRALIAGALHMAFKELGVMPGHVDALAVGLPVYSFATLRDALTREMRKPFLVPVPLSLRGAFGSDAARVEIKKVRVLPQPFGAMTDWRSRLTTPPADTDVVIIADPGYKTFDWFAMRGHVTVPDLSGAFDGGVSELLRAVSADLIRKHPNAPLDLQTIEDGLERGKLSFAGVGVLDFADYRQTMRRGSQQVVKRMADLLQRQQNKARVDYVVLAGGGAPYFEDAMRETFSGVDFSVLPRPVLANARGFWRAALRM